MTIVVGVLVTIIVLYLLIVVVSAWFANYSIRGIIAPAPSDSLLAGLDFENISFVGGDKNLLRGWFVHGVNNPDGRTVIIAHSWTHTRAFYVPHIKLFTKHGYHVLAYDARSHGSSDTARLTYGEREAFDFLAAYEFATQHPDVNPNKIIAHGASLGGSAIIHAMQHMPVTNIKGFLNDAPWATSDDVIFYLLEVRLGRFAAKWLLASFNWLTNVSRIGKVNKARPIDHIHLMAGLPKYFIRTLDDLYAPPHTAEAMVAAAPEPKDVWVNEHGDHVASIYNYPEEYEARVIPFLQRCVDNVAMTTAASSDAKTTL